ncbi:hypothetical protein SNE40_004386 [Patella caerulea]|uniref:Phospholipid/glycerol acyltransferase domain-containing protein n=1 Tax=Patella caerulea TaxID=87958 RepID=A0AAN8K8N6_PATCE
MLLSLILYLQALKWFAPTAIMLGTAPSYLTVWTTWRILTAILPSRFYRRGDDMLYSTYQRFLLFFFEHYTGVQIFLYGDVEAVLKKKEKVFYISNHQCTMDWVVCDMLAIRQGSLGNLRYILKDGLKYFPLYGFYFAEHGCVYVKRSGKFEQTKAAKRLSVLQRNNTPTWMVVFPEGTRFNPELPETIAKSQQFAKEEGFTLLSNVLTPRHKAVHVGLSNLRASLDAVYDVTIGYSNTLNKDGQRIPAAGMPDFLSGKVPEIHLHVKRFPIEEVPEDINGLRSWLHDRFVEKEKLMSHFYSRATLETFPGEVTKSKTSIASTLPSFMLWGGISALFLSTAEGRSLYWKIGLVGTLSGFVYVRLRV